MEVELGLDEVRAAPPQAARGLDEAAREAQVRRLMAEGNDRVMRALKARARDAAAA